MDEKIYFKTSDNLTLCGILTTPRIKTQKCVVLCHGITVDKDEDGIFTKLAKELVDVGFSVFRFDFRGHGESEGNSVDLTISGEEQDLEAAVKLLEEKGYKEFGVLGASFSGGAVSYYSFKHQGLVKALVLWNAEIDYKSLNTPITPWDKKYWGQAAYERVEKHGFTEIGSRKFKIGGPLLKEIKVLKPWEELLKLRIPVLFVHGDKDTYIDVADSIKYAKMMNAELEIIKGAEHGFHDLEEHAKFADKVTIEFFKKYL